MTDDFSRIGSAGTYREKSDASDINSNDTGDKIELHQSSVSFFAVIKSSGTPNTVVLKWIGISAVVTVAVVTILIVCLAVLKTDDFKNNRKTTVPYQKDKISSTTVGPSGPPNTSTQPKTTKGFAQNTTTVSSTSMYQTTSSILSSTVTTAGNGTWSNWGPWTMCGVTCGKSIHSRYRTCIKSSTNHTNCLGGFKEQKECTTTTCPVYGIWTTWGSWSNCDVTCGSGTQTRSRNCTKSVNTATDCIGRSTQQQTCSDWACPDCSKVCSTGTLNSQCDACECSTIIQGQVRNVNGGPLINVSVAQESAPHREIAVTNENGTFVLNSVCSQDVIILKKSGYQETISTITTTSITIEMQLIQYPLITTQPKPHLRLQGESVEFCCNASGNPAITSYEWLKNGNLINESFYSDGSTLVLSDLKFTDSGNVICRANSPVGAVYSDIVSLTVRENADDFCSDAYEPYEINLPSDCIQTTTNSVKYDIGRCSPKDCRMNNTSVQQSCSIDKKHCCTPSGREKQIIQCTGYSFPLYVTTSCTCGECEDTNITLYGQAVGATSGHPLRFGRIEIDGTFVGSTGIVGDFSFNIPKGTTRIVAIFKDVFFNQFLDTLKVIRLNEELSGRFYVHISMIETTPPINIDSSVSNVLQLGNQNGDESIASITIPPNSIFYQNGTRYNGMVKASLNFFDPRNSSSIQDAPGEFISVDDEGQTQNLQSFGVFSLSLQDQSGSSLQIAGETEIRLDRTFFESSSIGNITDAKLWGLNHKTGIWEAQETLSVLNSKRRKRQSLIRRKRQSTFLVGAIQISAYPWWNIDVPYSWRYCYFKSQVFEGEAQISNFIVRVIYRNSGSVVGFQENYLFYERAVSAICRTGDPLAGYIQVENNGKMFPVDTTNSGLTPEAESLIKYQVIGDRTLSADVNMADTGPFYDSFFATFENTFRFKLLSNEYSLKVLNPTMQEAVTNNHPGNEVWYPPLNSFLASEVQYRTCFIKIGTVNANSNLLFRVFSKLDDNTILGIHEKGLTNGATCIEYRCSVQNPDFDLNKIVGNDFFRNPKTYTLIRIEPIGQLCSVSAESSLLRTHEQSNMGWSSPGSNLGNTFFEANIPDNEYEGIFFHKSDSFEGISDARNFAIKECNKGVHSSFSESEEDMTPSVGLATTFTCL